MSGLLITFEGVEGSGKTTQIQQLQQWLASRGQIKSLQIPIIITREPGGTVLGGKLRHLLLDLAEGDEEAIQYRAELLLYAADRAQHVDGFLKPWLAKQAIILCDRYSDSTVAYQGYGRGLDLNLIDQINQLATQGLTSQLTFWLDLEVDLGLLRASKRGQSDRMEKADSSFHQRVRLGYSNLAAQNPDRTVRVDASLPIEQVAQQVQTIWQQRFPGLC